MRGEGHAGPEGVRVAAAGEAMALEVLDAGVLVEDPPQGLPLDGGGVQRQPFELGDHLLDAKLTGLLPRHLAPVHHFFWVKRLELLTWIFIE